MHDVDRPGGKAGRVGFRGRLQFAQSAANFAAFLRATGLSRGDLDVDVLADVDPGAGPERVVAGGTVIGVISDGFTYMSLPVASADDVLEVRVVDFDGSGRKGILGRYRQFGNGGSREVVAVWFAKGDGGFEQAIAFEVGKAMGERSLRSDWELVPRGTLRGKGRRQRGKDILVHAAEATGWDEGSYREAPAPDVRPILLPWGDKPAELHYFEGTTAYTEEAPRLRKARRSKK